MVHVLIVLASLLIPFAPSQGKNPSDVCSSCHDKGVLPCPEHSAGEIDLEKNAEACSVVCACPKCYGTLEVDCEKCSIGDKAWAAKVDAKKKWLAAQKPHFDLFHRNVRVAWSKHFEVTWEHGKLVVGQKTTQEHAALHLYLDRCEALMADFQKTFGCTDADFHTRFRIMTWERFKDHQIAGANYCSQPNPDTSVKRMGYVGIYSVHIDPSKVDPDESVASELARAVTHNVAHLLLANVWNSKWPGEMQAGWIDEGVSHYFEDKYDRRCTNFCYREQDTTQSYKGGRWREPVKKLAASKDRPPFADTATKRTDQLTLEEHALSWSYCEFLIGKNGPGFGKVCRAVKEGKGYRDALKSEFGYNALAFEDDWKKHVKSYGK